MKKWGMLKSAAIVITMAVCIVCVQAQSELLVQQAEQSIQSTTPEYNAENFYVSNYMKDLIGDKETAPITTDQAGTEMINPVTGALSLEATDYELGVQGNLFSLTRKYNSQSQSEPGNVAGENQAKYTWVGTKNTTDSPMARSGDYLFTFYETGNPTNVVYLACENETELMETYHATKTIRLKANYAQAKRSFGSDTLNLSETSENIEKSRGYYLLGYVYEPSETGGIEFTRKKDAPIESIKGSSTEGQRELATNYGINLGCGWSIPLPRMDFHYKNVRGYRFQGIPYTIDSGSVDYGNITDESGQQYGFYARYWQPGGTFMDSRIGMGSTAELVFSGHGSIYTHDLRVDTNAESDGIESEVNGIVIKHKYRYIKPDGTTYYFNDAGQCVAKGDRFGNKICYVYDGKDNVVKIVDSNLRELTFVYGANPLGGKVVTEVRLDGKWLVNYKIETQTDPEKDPEDYCRADDTFFFTVRYAETVTGSYEPNPDYARKKVTYRSKLYQQNSGMESYWMHEIYEINYPTGVKKEYTYESVSAYFGTDSYPIQKHKIRTKKDPSVSGLYTYSYWRERDNEGDMSNQYADKTKVKTTITHTIGDETQTEVYAYEGSNIQSKDRTTTQGDVTFCESEKYTQTEYNRGYPSWYISQTESQTYYQGGGHDETQRISKTTTKQLDGYGRLIKETDGEKEAEYAYYAGLTEYEQLKEKRVKLDDQTKIVTKYTLRPDKKQPLYEEVYEVKTNVAPNTETLKEKRTFTYEDADLVQVDTQVNGSGETITTYGAQTEHFEVGLGTQGTNPNRYIRREGTYMTGVENLTDAQGNPLTGENAVITTSKYYNEYGQLEREIDGRGNEVNYTYQYGDVVEVQNVTLGKSRRFMRDYVSNTVEITNEEDERQRISYDSVGRYKTSSLVEHPRYGYASFTIESVSYDPDSGFPVTKKNPQEGNGKRTETQYTFTPWGQILSETTYAYDSNAQTEGRLLSDKSYTYDLVPYEGKTVQKVVISSESGPDSTLYFDSDGQLLYNETTGLGTKQYTYDRQGNVTTYAGPEGTIAYTYDYAGRMLTQTQFGKSERSEYDMAGRLIASYDKANVKTAYTYNELGQVIETRVAMDDTKDSVVKNYYSAGGDKTRVLTNAGAGAAEEYKEVRYSFDAQGNPVYTTLYDGENQNVTKSEFDALGRLKKQTVGLTSRTDTGGASTAYQYDQYGKMIRTTDALGQATQYTYDYLGNVLTMQARDGRTVTNVYGGGNQLQAVTAAKAGVSETLSYTYEYDRVKAITDGMNAAVEYRYDAASRIVGIDYVNMENGAEVNRMEVTHALNQVGNPTNYRLEQTRGAGSTPGGTLTEHFYHYDAENRLQKVSEARTNTPLFSANAYDALDRMTAYSYGSLTYSQSYNNLGQIVEMTARTGVSSAITERNTYEYYADGNVRENVRETDDNLYHANGMERTYTSGYTYNGFGQLVGAAVENRVKNTGYGINLVSKTAAYSYAYDSYGNRVSDRLDVAQAGASEHWSYVNTYAYDGNNRLVGSKYEIGRKGSAQAAEPYYGVASQTTYTHDAAGNLVGSDVWRGVENAPSMAAVLSTLNEIPAEILAQYEQEQAAAQAQANDSQSGPDTQAGSSGKSDSGKTGTSGSANTAGTENAGSPTAGADTQTQPDASGRSSKSGTQPGSGSQTGSGSQSGSPNNASGSENAAGTENAGSPTSGADTQTQQSEDSRTQNAQLSPDSPPVSEANEYDVWGRVSRTVTEMTVGTKSGEAVLEFAYYPDGLRRSKTVTFDGIETTTIYVWDENGQLVAELDGQYNVQRQYDRVGSKVVRGILDGNVKYYYMYNAHGDVTGLADRAGKVVERYAYGPFGELVEGNPRGMNPLRYCGEYTDFETGQIYLRARMYAPKTGRFTQEDTHWNHTNSVYGDSQLKKTGGENYTHQVVAKTIKRQQIIKKHIDNFYSQQGLTSTEKIMEAARWRLGQLTTQEKQMIEREVEGVSEVSKAAIIQSGNLYSYCMNNPVSFIDPSGNSATIAVGGTVAAIIVAAKAIGIVIVGTAAIVAIVKTIEAIQNAYNNAVFYEAWISKGSVQTGRALTTVEAAVRVLLGGSVYSKSYAAAYNLAKLASGGKEPMHHDPHGSGSGYKYHFHLNNHANGAHIWYY